MNKTKKILSLMLAMCVAFTGMISMATIDAHAASVKKPAKVTGLKASATSVSTVKITYKKAKKASGYAIYRNGKWIKSVTGLSYTDSKLKASTKYTYKVRAYKSYKQKQYYNSKTKKWQVKKPKKSQWKGKKTKYVTKYKYGKYSATVSVKTKAAPQVAVPVVTATAEGMTATLTWGADKNATEFVVYRNGDVVGTTKETSYTDTPGYEGVYMYEVEAVNAYGRKLSAVVRVQLAEVTPGTEPGVEPGTDPGTEPGSDTPASEWPTKEEAQKAAFEATNAFLTARDRSSVEWDERVAAVAQKKAEYMAKTGKMAIRISDLGGDAWDMLEAAGMVYMTDYSWVGEGYAKNIKVFDDTMFDKIDEATGDSVSYGSIDFVGNGYTHVGIGYCDGYISIIFIDNRV